MKKSWAILLALVLGMSLCFSACGEKTPQPPAGSTETEGGNGSEPSETPDGNQDDNQDDDKQDDPDTPPQPPARTKAEAVADFDAAVQKTNADKNFTYTEIGAEYIAAFEGAKLKVTENGASVFYATEGDKHYSYTLRGEVWHKDYSETTAAGIFSALTAVLSNVIWSDFEAEDNLLSGTASGETIEATVTETALTIETAQKRFTLTKLGTTAVSLPADAVDDTDASNFIFTTDENGETVWNVRAIKEVLEAWAKNEMTDEKGNHVDNQFGQDVFAYRRFNPEYKSREVIYVIMADRLTFGMIFDVEEKIRFGEIYIDSNVLRTKIDNQEVKTKSDLATFLKTIKVKEIQNNGPDFDVEYTTHDEDYETAHKQEFVPMTLNIIEKGKEDSEFGEFFENLSVLFGYRTPLGDMGLIYCPWGWGCVAQNTKTLKMYYVYATISGAGRNKEDALSRVVNGDMKNFSVWDIRIVQIDVGNVVLYD